MAQTEEQESPAKVDLADIKQSVSEELEQVEEFIRDQIQPDNPVLAEAIDENTTLRGKRMRPCLLLLSAKATGGIREEHFRVAAIAELIHAATLVHDDVLDQGEMRREHITMNERFGNELAVLFGDYIFSGAYEMTVDLEDAYARKRLARTARDVCRGEVWQTGNKYNYDLDKSTYLEIIRLKTASLFGTCTHLGAYLNDADTEQVEQLETFGEHFGMAFQIADDYLDLAGTESTIGKSLGTDLFKGKMTLPIIQLFSSMNDAEREEALDLLETHSRKAVEKKDMDQAFEQFRNELREHFMKWMSKYELHTGHSTFTDEYLSGAREALSRWNGNPAIDKLEQLIDFARQRRY